jgi:hypothetical protein
MKLSKKEKLSWHIQEAKNKLKYAEKENLGYTVEYLKGALEAFRIVKRLLREDDEEAQP